MRYDTVLLDADGTLLDFSRSEREAVADALREIGVSPTEEMIAVYSEINDGLWKRLERGEIPRSVLAYRRFELLFERYGIGWDARDMAARYMEKLSHRGYVIDGARELCARLSASARLYLITNGTDWIQQGRLADSGLLPYFQDVFISDRIGHQKPSAEYFAFVEAHIPRFDPTRTLVVGDSLTSDMAGGIAYGLDTCWYNPRGTEAPAEMGARITVTVKDFDELARWILMEESL